MKAALRTGALGAALLAHGTLAQDAAGCFVHAKMYDDNALDGFPTAGYVTGEASCQKSCQISPTCKQWTWKAVGNPYKGILDNGCWTLSGSDLLQTVNFSTTPGRVVSGPKYCPTQAPNATTAPVAPVATVAPLATAAPTEAGNATNATNATVLTDASGSGGGFPWWGILLIAGVAVCIGLALIGCSCSSKKASKKKKKDKKTKRSGPTEVDAPLVIEEGVEAAPLMQPPVLAEPVTAVAQAAPAATFGGVQMMQPMMAAPIATMNYQPVAYMQQPVYSFAPVGMPARQPQFTVG